MIGLFVLTVLSTTIILSRNLVLTYIVFFCYGFCPVAIYTVGYPYVLEFFSDKEATLAGSIIMSTTTFNPIYAILLIRLFNTTVYWEAMVAAVACIAGVYTWFVMPESPRFYYARNRFDEARCALRRIAKVNGVNLTHTIRFDKENDFM